MAFVNACHYGKLQAQLRLRLRDISPMCERPCRAVTPFISTC